MRFHVVVEVEILLETVSGGRVHLGGIGYDVAAILLTHVHSKPMVTQLRLEQVGRLRRQLKLMPLPGPGPGNIAPDLIHEQVTPFHLRDHLGNVSRREESGVRPYYIAQVECFRIALEVGGEVHEFVVAHLELAHGGEVRLISKQAPGGRLHAAARIVRVFPRVKKSGRYLSGNRLAFRGPHGFFAHCSTDNAISSKPNAASGREVLYLIAPLLFYASYLADSATDSA